MNSNSMRRIATRGLVGVLPAAIVVAYAGHLPVPTPPRLTSYRYVEAAEIVDSPSTVGVADSDLYGMTDEEISTELDRLQSLGVEDIRVFVPWGLVEYADGTYNWSYVDSIMNAAAERNMGVMVEVNATPSWAAADSSSSNTPAGSATPNVADFTDFMRTLAERYGSTVSAYEIWNEPNYVSFSNPIDPTAYAELLKSVYPVLKEIDPTATVVAGALGTVQDSAYTMNAVTFVQQMLAAGAGDYFDAISVHPYQDSLLFSDGYSCSCGGQLTPLQEIDAIKALIGTDKTVWITEYGLSTVNGAADEAKQAQYIEDLLDYWQTYSQAGPVFLYTGSDSATDSTDPEDDYGLFYQDGDPKEAAEMLAAWIAAHVTTTTTTTSTAQVDPVAQAIQAVAAAINGVISQAVQAVSALAQAIVTAITNVVTGLTRALSPLGSAASAVTAQAATTQSSAKVETASLEVAASTDTTATTEATASARSAAEAPATASSESAPDASMASAHDMPVRKDRPWPGMARADRAAAGDTTTADAKRHVTQGDREPGQRPPLRSATLQGGAGPDADASGRRVDHGAGPAKGHRPLVGASSAPSDSRDSGGDAS